MSDEVRANARVTVQEYHSEKVENDTGAGRYYISLGGKQDVGFVAYEIGDDFIRFTHTEVEQKEREKGVGSRLIEAVLDDVRDTGDRRVIPDCPFVAEWIAEHPAYRELTTR